MATRGQIGIQYKDGSITSVYSHFDNYITDGNGELLFNNYNDLVKANNLISLGNISSLDDNIESTRFYGRDMNRKGEEAGRYKNFKDWQKNSSYGYVDYNYLYDAADGEWYVWEGYNDRVQGMPLSTALASKLGKGGKIISEYEYAKGGNIKNEKKMAGHKKHAHGGRHSQGYNARLDESLAMRRGKKRQNFKDRRDESKGAERARLRRAYSSVDTMDRYDSPYRLARGGDSSRASREMLRRYDVRSPYGTYDKGGDVYSGSGLSNAGESNFTFSGDRREEVYTGRDVNMMARRGRSLKKRGLQRAQGGNVYTGSSLSQAGNSKFTFKGEPQGDVYTGRDVSMMAAQGGDVYTGSKLSNAGDSQFTFNGMSDGSVYSGSNLSKAGDAHFTFKGQPKGDVYTGRDVNMMAAQGGSKLMDAGNADFTFSGKSGSEEVYTGRDVNMMAARGKSLKKVKKASKGGETGIGMF